MKKNVVVILCDQLRTDYLSCYGSEFIKTPNIDKLAADGVLFEHATTVSPVCAPGRASMMTGTYLSDHGVWTNEVPFRPGLEYLPQRMKANGYRTGAFGKLHHTPGKDSKGFDIALQMEENRLGPEDDFYKYIIERHPEAKNLYNHDGSGKFGADISEYYDVWIAENAIKFIEDEKDKPVFAWISFQGPHPPYDVPANNGLTTQIQPPDPADTKFLPKCDVPLYRRGATLNSPEVKGIEAYRRQLVAYAHKVQLIDIQVAKIVAKLKELGIYEDTIIIFSTDHGCMLGDYSMFGKGAMPYKAQLEIPMIISNSPELPKGVRSDMLVSNLDIGGTAIKVAGDDKPFAFSRSMIEMYNTPAMQRSVIFTEFCDSMKLVSSKEYRLAYYPFSGQYELFKIDNEREDLTDKPEYLKLQIKLLTDIIDFVVMAKGEVYLEGHDTVPAVQKGLDEKYYNYREVAPLATPLGSERIRENLRKNGLDADYTEFMKEREDEFVCHYGKYWNEKETFFKKTYHK
ncbi:sulfatase [Candidatus Epulonipiscium viviparus]|uniref:sulfatase family protein n=1 Tax=Candidatus Epulonipiscium viviparus TaxID=420336 RepID=UPI0004969A04|nr:sulfatase-like hydrolase/transferase [Candidatus Epulopiscium viviparus]